MSRNQFGMAFARMARRAGSFFTFSSLSAVCFGMLAAQASAASLIWSKGPAAANWNTTDLNWNSDTTAFTDGGVDDVNFLSTSGGVVNIDADGVTPKSITVSATNGTYTFAGGPILGTGGLVKSGAGILAIGSTYTGMDYTGTTEITGGVLQISHNSNGGVGDPSDRSLGGNVLLNGGTLRFQHIGVGHSNPVLTFTNTIEVGAAGGTIDFNGASNGFNNTLGSLQLAGNLTVTGNTGSPSFNGAPYNFTGGAHTLLTDATITNATTTAPNTPHAVALNPNISGATRTLTFERTGTGGGFQILNIDNTTNGLNIAALNSNASLVVSTATGADPFDKIQANGGVVTMGAGTTLTLFGRATSDGTQLIDPTAIVWQGNNTLTLQRVSSGNNDTSWTLQSDLNVSTASGLTTLNYGPWRSGNLNATGGNDLIIESGGNLNVTIARSDNSEFADLNMRWHNGATITGTNSTGMEGGLIRAVSATLNLGDGSGTANNPSVITIRGNHGTITDTFNIGYANNATENGVVRMRYANTSATAGSFFNVGWSNGGAIAAALLALKETSGGTEFAPLAGSGGVAIVGPSSGTVATFTNDVQISAAGTVGFHNRGTNNVRGALGAVVIESDLSGIGTLAASTITFDGGSLSPGLNGAGTLSLNGNLLMDSTTVLNLDLTMPNTIGSGVNDLVVVTGDVTLDGSIELVETPIDGTYTILTYTGALTDNGLVLPTNVTLDFSTFGQVNLVYTTPIPEPASWLLVAGLAVCAIRRRRSAR